MKTAIRYLSYPLVAGGAAIGLFALAGRGVAYWPVFPLIVIGAITCVAALERISPYQPVWNTDHDGDTGVDVLHFLVSYGLIQAVVVLAFGFGGWLPQGLKIWPETLPMTMQILLVGMTMDLGLYIMHRVSHRGGLLWRLHAIHHAPERIYWLNGGRRHPLSALVLASPGLVVLLTTGATPIAVGAWMSFMSVHLAFQHANLDYRLGSFCLLLGVAEMHRFHHKRDFEDAQVNFGEVFLIWDHLFGTFHDASVSMQPGEVGLKDRDVPGNYIGQILWPMKRSRQVD
tara:strand:- start:31384 stop:32241 length:858 start_codon:yes stop_codon:yes gene_type:complete